MCTQWKRPNYCRQPTTVRRRCRIARTPIGGLQGVFADLKATELGAAAIREAVKRAGATNIDQIAMGCVLSAGQGQAPARQAGLGAGLSENVPAMTHEADYGYAKHNGFTAVAIPYIGSDLQFVVFLPDAANGLAALEPPVHGGVVQLPPAGR